MGYSAIDSMVRVDFFKPSGKWYCTEAIDFEGLYELFPRDALLKACEIDALVVRWRDKADGPAYPLSEEECDMLHECADELEAVRRREAK